MRKKGPCGRKNSVLDTDLNVSYYIHVLPMEGSWKCGSGAYERSEDSKTNVVIVSIQ